MEKLIIIGGSAGSLDPLNTLLKALPSCHRHSLILVIHRQRNVPSVLDSLLSHVAHDAVTEPDDKTEILPGHIYLAPQNYHLLVEADGTIALEYSEAELYSRPSINVTMESASIAFGRKVTGILLSGANADGAAGLKKILSAGGEALIQDPEEALFPTMPEIARDLNPEARVLPLAALTAEIRHICSL